MKTNTNARLICYEKIVKYIFTNLKFKCSLLIFIEEKDKMGSTERFVIPGMRICAAQDNYQSGKCRHVLKI